MTTDTLQDLISANFWGPKRISSIDTLSNQEIWNAVMARKNRHIRRKLQKTNINLCFLTDLAYKKAEHVVTCNFDRTWATLSWEYDDV